MRLTRSRALLAMLLTTVLAAALGLDLHGGRARARGRYDAILLAGAGVLPGGRPSRPLASRARRAAELFHEGRAPLVVVTGGVGASPPSEAAVAASLLVGHGVPSEAILLEDRSTSTRENARFARALLPAARRVLVVTDRFHVLRARRTFAQAFPEVDAVGCVSAPWPRMRGALREVVAVGAHAAFGDL